MTIVFKAKDSLVSINTQKETIWRSDKDRVNIINLKENEEIKPHIHDGNHIWVVISGKGNFLSKGSGRLIKTGTVIIAPAGEEHGVTCTTEEGLTIVSISVN